MGPRLGPVMGSWGPKLGSITGPWGPKLGPVWARDGPKLGPNLAMLKYFLFRCGSAPKVSANPFKMCLVLGL